MPQAQTNLAVGMSSVGTVIPEFAKAKVESAFANSVFASAVPSLGRAH
jgi:hypothetical protein